MARVVIANVSKTFSGPRKEGIHALKNVSLTVEDKEFLALVGPSGCGKTTILRLIAGLEEITEGTISIDGRVVNNVEPKDRDLAMVFQNYALYPHMTVYENMAFGLQLRKVPKAEIEQRVRQTATTLGLGDCLQRLPKALSGGQRQRVAVGRAIVRQPKVFLFDEPLSNLDAQMRVQLRQELAKLHARLAATMIYVTHDQAEAMTLGDRIAVMRHGAVQQVADPIEVYRRPANLFVAGFIGSPPMNFFPGSLVGSGGTLRFQGRPAAGTATAAPSALALNVDPAHASVLAAGAGKPIILGLRPEAITDARLTPAAPGACLDAVVEVVEPMGPETFLHLTGAGYSFVARVPAARKYDVNEKLQLALNLREAHYFDPTTELSLLPGA